MIKADEREEREGKKEGKRQGWSVHEGDPPPQPWAISGHQLDSITDTPVMTESSEKIRWDWTWCFLQQRLEGHLSNKIQKIQATGAVTPSDPENFLVWNRALSPRTPPKWSVNALSSRSVWPGLRAAQTGCCSGLEERLPTLELQPAWPGQGHTPSLDHTVPYGELISVEQLGPAYNSSKILQDELLLSCSYKIK